MPDENQTTAERRRLEAIRQQYEEAGLWQTAAQLKTALSVTKPASENQITLPPGFRVLNDGPHREVLLDDRTDDPAPVFATREEAIAKAWQWWREIYQYV